MNKIKSIEIHDNASVGNGRDRSLRQCDRSLQNGPPRPERKPMRLTGYDYSTNGAYFVTICIKNGICNFGNVVISDGLYHPEIVLNEYGKIIETQWKWLFDRYMHISMDDYVIMPDHFHGIIHFSAGNDTASVGNGRDRSLQSPQCDRSLYIQKERIKPLPQIIGAFKTTSSKLIHSAGCLPFKWQKSYYDRVIRDELELQNVRQYIRSNPLKKHLSDESDSPFGDPDA
jgi:REP element-mobilizing transposase RayT